MAFLKILYRSRSLKSWLWRLWLSFPNVIRARVYHILLYFFGRSFGPSTYRIPLGIYAKVLISPEEALATEFVRHHTTIPVPKVLDVLPYTPTELAAMGRSTLMITKEIPGVPLSSYDTDFSLSTATLEQKEIFRNTLFDWLTQLRSISPPHPQKVCGFLGGGLYSYRIKPGLRVGPYKSPTEFHAQGFCDASIDYPEMAEDPDRIGRLIAERPNKKYRICLTHGDIQPHNLLVDDAGRPCGLIDWECASWMPEYWEHTYALRIYLQRDEDWSGIWKSMFPEYEDDLDVEIRTWLWYDPF